MAGLASPCCASAFSMPCKAKGMLNYCQVLESKRASPEACQTHSMSGIRIIRRAGCPLFEGRSVYRLHHVEVITVSGKSFRIKDRVVTAKRKTGPTAKQSC